MSTKPKLTRVEKFIRDYESETLRTEGKRVSLYPANWAPKDHFFLDNHDGKDARLVYAQGLKSTLKSMRRRKDFKEQTHEEKCKALDFYLKEAKEYNKWRRETKDFLLNNLAPRIAALGKVGYMGCGFHYSKETEIATLIARLAYPCQPCMNHFDKCKDEYFAGGIYKVRFELLLEQVEEAEKSAGISQEKA